MSSQQKTVLSASWKTLTVVPVAPVPTVEFVVLQTPVVPTAIAIQPAEPIPDNYFGDPAATAFSAANCLGYARFT